MTPSPETSDSLIARVQNPNDQLAWMQFDAIYRPVIYRVARRSGWQDSDANDLAQRVLLLVAKAIPDWERDHERAGFRSWLYRVARNALVSMLREGKSVSAIGGSDFLSRVQAVEAPTNDIERMIDEEDRRSRLRLAGEQVRHEFTETSWRAFWLTTLEECPVAEAAKKLGLSTGAVYAARSRIMRRLQEVAESDFAKEQERT